MTMIFYDLPKYSFTSTCTFRFTFTLYGIAFYSDLAHRTRFPLLNEKVLCQVDLWTSKMSKILLNSVSFDILSICFGEFIVIRDGPIGIQVEA